MKISTFLTVKFTMEEQVALEKVMNLLDEISETNPEIGIKLDTEVYTGDDIFNAFRLIRDLYYNPCDEAEIR